MFEPVRRNGNLNKKHHGNKRTLDWWTVDKSLEWSPAAEGKQVSLNHDYGQKAKFKAAAKATPDKGTGGDQPGKAAPDKPGASGKSTISQGAAGLWEYEARDKGAAEKPKSSVQAGSDAKEGAKSQAEKESWAYKYLVPPLWKPDGHPEKEWAKAVMKEELTGFAQAVLAVPDPVVDSVHAYGEWQKRKGR